MHTPVRITLGIMAVGTALGCSLVSGSSVRSTESPTPPVASAAAATLAADTPVAPTSAPEPSPPPLHADWPVYRNETFGFELRYPPDGVIVAEEAQTARIDLPYVPGTNLHEKYLQIDASGGATPCASPLASGWAPGSLPTETRDIAGLTFTIQNGAEGAAGNFYQWAGYSTVKGDVCVSLSFVLHSTNAMNYTPPLAEFDPAAESAVFDEIVATFVWTAP